MDQYCPNSPPLSTSTAKVRRKQNVVGKKTAPLWRGFSLEGVPPCPNFDNLDQEESAFLEEEDQKRKIDEQRELFRHLRIRPKFLRWVPAEMKNITTMDTLLILLDEYTLGKGKGYDELCFLYLMEGAINDQIRALKISPSL